MKMKWRLNVILITRCIPLASNAAPISLLTSLSRKSAIKLVCRDGESHALKPIYRAPLSRLSHSLAKRPRQRADRQTAVGDAPKSSTVY